MYGRVFGNKFAEMPFVATKEGYRREGNCKRLLKVPYDMLVTCLHAQTQVLCWFGIQASRQ